MEKRDNSKVVYLHRNKTTNEVFYVGMGGKNRPYDKKKRNNFWKNYVNKYGYYVEIFKRDLSLKEACDEERRLISFYGRRDLNKGSLVNLSNGGEGSVDYTRVFDSKPCICLKSGNVYESVRKYCEINDYPYTTILNFLKNDLNEKPDRYDVRFLRKDNSIIWENKKDKFIDFDLDTDSLLDIEDANYNCDLDLDLDNKLSLVKAKIKDIDFTLVVYYLNSVLLNKSLRAISSEFGIGKDVVFRVNKSITDYLNGTSTHIPNPRNDYRELTIDKYGKYIHLLNDLSLNDVENSSIHKHRKRFLRQSFSPNKQLRISLSNIKSKKKQNYFI